MPIILPVKHRKRLSKVKIEELERRERPLIEVYAICQYGDTKYSGPT